MAFCGIVFLEEKKTGFVEDDSLKDVQAFSTIKGACAVSKEGLLTVNDDGVKEDRRTKIIYNEKQFHRTSYTALEHLTARLPNQIKFVGSCTSINIEPSKWYKLTCAHNVVGYNKLEQRWIKLTNIRSYQSRQGEDTYVALRKGDEKTIRFHPEYNNSPDCGFDIAVFEAPEKLGWKYVSSFPNIQKIDKDVRWMAVGPELIKMGMSVEIPGYPGEKDGWPYTHTGVIKHITKTKQNGWLIWYNVDLTPGTSGSPIMITDKNFVKKFSKNSETKLIVGVHTGYAPMENLNFGTLITPTIGKWIKNGGK